MGTHLLPPAWGPRDSLRGILPQPWPETLQKSHHTPKSSPDKQRAQVPSLEHLRDKCACLGCRPGLKCSSCVSAVSRTKLSLSPCCGSSLPVLYCGPFETRVFSKGKENILCYLEFSTVTLCPEVTCPSKETFSIM